jgi:hypothetical protein
LIEKLDPDPHKSQNTGVLEAHNRAVEAVEAHSEGWRLKMELWMVFRPLVADSHHIDEEQNPNPR